MVLNLGIVSGSEKLGGQQSVPQRKQCLYDFAIIRYPHVSNCICPLSHRCSEKSSNEI